MFQAIRKQCSASTLIATLALVFAMTGGAYAAGKYLITSTKQIKPSVLASLKGNAGANGAPGAQGPAGPAGKEGPAGPAGKEGPAGKGEAGKEGPEGKEGKAGTNGKNVTSTELSAGNASGHCAEGGAEFESTSGKTYACNGKEGPTGPTGPGGATGSEGNIKGTLAAGETETGVWNFEGTTAHEQGKEIAQIPLSFPIPLSKALTEECEEEAGEICQIHFIYVNGEEETPLGRKQHSTDCKGTAAEPTAEPGNLCIYSGKTLGAHIAPDRFRVTSNPGVSDESSTGAGTTGALLWLKVTAGVDVEEESGYGTWAVREAG